MKKIYAIAAVAAVLSAFSCSRISPDALSGGEGSISLGVNIDGTKASMTDEELLNTASVRIYMADFSGLVRSYTYADAPSKIYLPVDSYRIDVVAGEAVKQTPSAASWEQKSYKGSADFSIVAGVNTPVTVNATVSNVITKVAFDDSIRENFNSGYTFTIGLSATDASSQLVYDASRSGSNGYFIASGFEPSLYWTFSGILAKDGSAFNKSGEITAVEGGKLYSMQPKFTVKDGDLGFELSVDLDTEVISDVIVFEPVSTGLAATPVAEIWAGHAKFYADVDESEYSDPTAIRFLYCAADSLSGGWKTVNATRASEGSYVADVTKLGGGTEYLYKLVIGGEEIGDSRTFTTEPAPQLPNWNFETVSHDESDRFYCFYDPASSDMALKTKFWDSGNSASASYGYVICNSSTDVPPENTGSTRCAILESCYAVVKFAAGNLFTGYFAGLDGLNGKVNFGRPFTARPTAVRFWYSYSAGKVTSTATGCPLTTSDYDSFSIQVALGTWSNRTYGGSPDSPVQVNTGNKSTLYKYQDLPETIAYCCLEGNGTGSRSDWQQVTIPLDYNSLEAWPTHIIVSCASSKYGDYFAGCKDAKLWIDDFELIYE